MTAWRKGPVGRAFPAEAVINLIQDSFVVVVKDRDKAVFLTGNIVFCCFVSPDKNFISKYAAEVFLS